MSQINGHIVQYRRIVRKTDNDQPIYDAIVTEITCLICGAECFKGVLETQSDCAVACAFCWNKLSQHHQIEEVKP